MSKKNELFLACGYVASGKTTVANALASAIGLEIIRTDDIRKELFPEGIDYNLIDLGNSESVEKIESWIKNNPRADFQQVLNPLTALKNEAYVKIIDKYAPKIKEQKAEVYDKAFAKLGSLLAAGKSVLFDATFSSANMRERAYQTAIESGVEKIYIIQVVCAEAIVMARLANRRSGKQKTTSNARQMEVFRKVKNEFDASRIKNDNNPELKIVRIMYDTGTHTVKQFGEEDETTKTIKVVLTDLSKQYAAVTR
ncbi:MAG: AAA family ATPase [Candidatus Paceibacterota bacterium]